MAQKRQQKKNRADNEIFGIILIMVSVFFLLCLTIKKILGDISLFINSVVIGTLGFMAYPLFLVMLLCGIAVCQKRKANIRGKYLAGIISISVFAVLILQLATSSQYLDGGFYGYISGVYKSFTAGGVLFGVFAYAVQSVVTPVFAYVVFALGIALTATLLSWDKLKNSIGREQVKKEIKKKYEPAATPEYKSTAFENTHNGDRGLFVNTIIPQTAKTYESAQSSFNALPQTPKINNIQTYSEPVKQEPGFIPYSEPAKDDKRTRMRNLFNEIKNTQAQPFAGSTGSQYSSTAAQYTPPTPPLITTQPDIKTIQPSVENARPPKILHFEEAGLQRVTIPPTKDFSDKIVEGHIINGDELSKRLAEERAPLKEERPAFDFGDFDKRKSEPVSAAGKAFLQEDKPEEPQEDTRPPIMNGDYFKFEKEAKPEVKPVLNDLPPQSVKTPSHQYSFDYNPSEKFFPSAEPEISEPVKEEKPQILEPYRFKGMPEIFVPPVSVSAKVPVIDNFADLGEKSTGRFNEEKDYFDEDEDNADDKILSAGFDDLISKNSGFAPKAKPDYIDDGEVLDLSEKGFENLNDTTGYYNAVKEEKPESGYKSPVGFGAFADEKPIVKLKPENQIRLDDYVRDAAPPVKTKVRRHHRYNPPPIDFLLASKSNSTEAVEADSTEKAKLLEETLYELKLPATVSAITRGPTVTRYELEMPPGIPIKRIEQYAKDIEYNLAIKGKIRIETPIPGKRAVGIEIPNEVVDIVRLKEIIASKEFNSATSPITLALGKDIAGSIITCQLDKMPHLLVAGQTGSGKSACLNSIIMSILYKASPEDVKLILIDPKRVEFTIYRDMPHLLTNEIITESAQTLNALKWLKVEMERRYTMFSKNVVRNLSEYNKLDGVKNGEMEKLPILILMIDEMADLMLSDNRKDLEERIMSLTAKSRAAGIHLILATQRPSVDVITGTIKANLPSCIAFAVKSVIDSRTILDSGGAEALLGSGDMIYAPAGNDFTRRVQGAFVTNEEVTSVVNYVRENNPAEFDEDFKAALMQKEENTESVNSAQEAEYDALVPNVLRLAIETGQVSTTFIQQRFSVGYPRASKIMYQMEKNKFISPNDGSNKPRTVYVTREQYKEMFGEEI